MKIADTSSSSSPSPASSPYSSPEHYPLVMSGRKREIAKISDEDPQEYLPPLKLKAKIIDRKKEVRLPNSAASKFMSVVSNQLLLEIFIRFPDGRSLIQSATVCKRWRSIIMTPFSREYFIEYQTRKQSLDSSYYPSYTTTIIFNYSFCKSQAFYKLANKKAVAKPYGLSLFNWEDWVVRASQGNFLLLVMLRNCRRYSIFNIFTEQWIALPDLPLELEFEYDYDIDFSDSPGSHGFALVFDSVYSIDDMEFNRCSYRVVLIYKSYFRRQKYKCCIAVFDSVDGKWALSEFALACQYSVSEEELCGTIRTNFEVAVSRSGVLHWLDGIEGLSNLVVLDPLSLKLRLVSLPSEKFGGIKPKYAKYKARLGVVRGRVRLSLMQQMDEAKADAGSDLKVWEFDSETDSWSLAMHNVVLKNIRVNLAVSFVLAFDISDENALFLVHGKKIYRYKIKQDKCKEVCGVRFVDILESVCGQPFQTRNSIGVFWTVLTLVHPLWPPPLVLS